MKSKSLVSTELTKPYDTGHKICWFFGFISTDIWSLRVKQGQKPRKRLQLSKRTSKDHARSIRRDAAFMARVAGGDKSATRDLVHIYRSPLIRFAAHLLKDPTEAEDVANEALMRLWQYADTWKPDGIVSGWLRRSVYNQCIDRLRKSGRMVADIDGKMALQTETPTPSPEAEAFGSEIGSAIGNALAKLPERQRAAVTLSTIDGLSGQEIADILGVSAEAVESLLARGRRALRQYLQGLYADISPAARSSQRRMVL